MISKQLSKIFKAALLFFISLLLILSFVFVAFQSKWAKNQIRQKMIVLAQQNGMELNFGSIEGNIPFRLTIHDLQLRFSEHDVLYVKRIKMRLSSFSLLRKEIAINHLSLQDASYFFSQDDQLATPLISLPTRDSLQSKISKFSLPFNLSLRSFKADSILIENSSTKSSGYFSLKGNAKIRKSFKDFNFYLKINGPPYFSSYAEFTFRGNKKEQYVAGDLQVQLKSAKAFKPFFSLPFEADCHLNTSLEGPWNTWAELITSDSSFVQSSALQGLFQAKFNHINYPGYEKLNQKCKIDSLFSISQNYEIEIQKFIVDGDFAEIKGKAQLGENFHLRNAFFSFNFPEISLLNPYLHMKLGGAIRGQGKCDTMHASFNFSTQNLQIANSSFSRIFGDMSANCENRTWNGHFKIEAEHPSIPMEMESEFNFQSYKTLRISDFIVKAPESQISGNLTYDLQSRSLDGLAFGQILHLKQFQELFPDITLDGSLGIETQFSSGQNGSQALRQQNFKWNLIAKNLRYQNYFINEVNFLGDFENLLADARGNCLIEASRIHHPRYQIQSLAAGISSGSDSWPFYLHAKGNCKEEFEFSTQGFWDFIDGRNQLSFSAFKGSAMQTAFESESPFSVDWNLQELQLNGCKMKVHEGFLHADLNLNKNFAQAKINAEHFPLDFIALAFPHFNLKGTSSLDIVVDAKPEHCSGHLNLLLEQANIQQKGSETPLNAKGALNVSMDQNIMQIHANLIATDQQFLDWNASLPIDCTPFPFKIQLDRLRPVSSELTMEGKLEEIFDFVNIGTHQATGLLSCHLFLSKNLSAPAINGKIELQSGTYENFSTGTYLRSIDAEIEAENNRMQLIFLKANDANEGTVQLTGELLLSPKEKFPFLIKAEMENLNCLRSELVTSSFTGKAQVKGDSLSATASGALNVSEAHFKIPDEMPVEIPELPITYINQPPHVKSSGVQTPYVYPVYLDLDLSAPDKIYLKGKGVESEWHGNLHLMGTNTNYAAKGVLKLTSGKFVFAGKTFGLSEGEITFIDKPTPSSHLSLSATLPLQNITITAFLRGPLTSPIITFQSMPQMPTSSLLSYVLFDKDISEINYFQAFQLAQVVMSLSGGDGPGVFEKIRKTLGVDRLGIVAGPKGIEQIAVQVGKYLTKGVLITLSQGADTSQIVVEVTIKEGFVFQAETQEDNAGKFILKWHKNY